MSSRRIILDARALHGRPGGIGTYTRALVDGLPPRLPDTQFLMLRHPEGPSDLDRGPNVEVATMPSAPPHGPATLLIRPLIRGRPGDIYHALFPVLPLGLHVPKIVTVHDLMWFNTPELVSENRVNRITEHVYHRIFVRHAFHDATLILSNSQSTRRDLLDRWPKLEPRVRLTPLAPSSNFGPGGLAPEPERLKRFVPQGARFFLVVGNGSGNKNHEAAVRAFGRACRDRTDTHMVVIQRSRVGLPRFREAMKQSGAEDRIHVFGPVDDEDVVTLMHAAYGFVFPSRYEGFGIAVLEAMAADCPVICSNAASLPEVAGEAGLLFDVDDIEGYAHGMRRILDDESLRQDLIRRGRERVASFTWERCVDATVAAYREIL